MTFRFSFSQTLFIYDVVSHLFFVVWHSKRLFWGFIQTVDEFDLMNTADGETLSSLLISIFKGEIFDEGGGNLFYTWAVVYDLL